MNPVPLPATSRSHSRLVVCLLMAVVLAAPAVAADRRPLWPGGAPQEIQFEENEKNPARPTIDHYPASWWTTGAAVIVCPGGGYGSLSTMHEGERVAQWFNEQGVIAFVLRYRHAPGYKHPVPVLDVQRAIRHVRFHAQAYGIDPAKIGVMGFSAGGHLASTAATHFDAGDPAAADPIDRVSSRPDFAILCYPVISFTEPFTHKGSRRNFFGTETPPDELARQFSNELQVTKDTPPVFLLHTDEDTSVPAENSVAFYLALRKAGVPAELHVYRQGRHGGGLWPGHPTTGAWPRQLARWMSANGLLNWPPVTDWSPSPSLPAAVDLAPIFNGRDLAGWQVPSPNPFWRVEAGVLIGENDPTLAGSLLRTEKAYHDFALEFEARWSEGADSGIIFRRPDLQMQLGVSVSRKTDLTASFYTGGKEPYPPGGRAANVEKLLRPGDWNRFRIEARGDTFTVWLNHRQVARYVDGRFAAPAPIALQIHSRLKMKVEFRDLRAAALD